MDWKVVAKNRAKAKEISKTLKEFVCKVNGSPLTQGEA